MDSILTIKGARQHNLKNISLTLPKGKLIVFTGVSGSGKSSLAFDTIYAEGQRRYVESLSSYARQFLGVMDKPDVDSIIGLSPSISIDQKSVSHNPRSTVATITEIYDYMRLLYARIGHPHCPACYKEITHLSLVEIVDRILNTIRKNLDNRRKKLYFSYILSPVVRDRKGEFSGLLSNLASKGYSKVRIDNTFYSTADDVSLIKTNRHSIDVVIDSLTISLRDLTQNYLFKSLRSRIQESVEESLQISGGYVTIAEILDKVFSFPEHPREIADYRYSEFFSCPDCEISIPEPEPRFFSFNSPHGACPRCSGIGSILSVDPTLILKNELSISEGGILPFTRMFFHDTWYARVIMTVAKKNGIDIAKPIEMLTHGERNIILYGTGDIIHDIAGTNRFGENTIIHEQFHGIVEELVRRHRETQSSYMREEIEKYMREEMCPECRGKRLKNESLNVTINGYSIADATALPISDALFWFTDLRNNNKNTLSERDIVIGESIFREILSRLQFLADVGLTYLSLDRKSATLSGGESQRIRLASQIGSGLSGVIYVLDEPSVGLHQRDNGKLITTLKKLTELENTVIVVEHDREMMMSSDYIVDFGPGAGDNGGNVIARGTYKQILNSKTQTSAYLSGRKKILRNEAIKRYDQDHIKLIGAKHNNLKNISLSIPIGKFICVTGVSGSGKSSLIVDTLYKAVIKYFFPFVKEKPGSYEKIEGMNFIDKCILIDQSAIGRTPRSNPATYTGVFTPIREFYSHLPDSRSRGYKIGRFSFNIKGGRCETCEGEGQKRIEMQFLADVFVTCEVCHGARYNNETLEVMYKDKTIADILSMSVDEALPFFSSFSNIRGILQTLRDVGLGYIKLGQPATTLSGGEAQRVKLATELARRATGRTLYILDEPTTGLHFADLEKLLHVLDRLTSSGNTVIVIEHNMDIIKNADWIIDMGPEGGDEGGRIVAEGKPSDIAKNIDSHTGTLIKKIYDS